MGTRLVGRKRLWQSAACIGMGLFLYMAAEVVDSCASAVENGRLLRNPCGKGEAVYEFYVDGLGDRIGTHITISVPEQKMTDQEFSEKVPELAELLCEKILGTNASLTEVRENLNLVSEIPEFGMRVSWRSEQPEVVNEFGIVKIPEDLQETSWEESGIEVYLEAVLQYGEAEEIVEIPVTVYPPLIRLEDRFRMMLEELVLKEPEQMDVRLPDEFEGQKLTYRSFGGSSNLILIVLGAAAAVCVYLKDFSDKDTRRKQRETYLKDAYPDFVTEFLILTGAGYSAKFAWKKMAERYKKKWADHPLCEELQIAMNRMETGVPETKVYADFGRRCQLRCYMKFASLLESSVNTGGRNLRKLLEGEMEEAFKQRADIAKRKGEELSSKLLLPMFGMLAVVMVMVISPAFLSFL